MFLAFFKKTLPKNNRCVLALGLYSLITQTKELTFYLFPNFKDTIDNMSDLLTEP